MKVFSVSPDVRKFRTLLPTDEAVWATGSLYFDCEPKGENWRPPELWCFNPKKRQGDFDYMGPGNLIAEPTAMPTVQEFFEMAGELLPIPFEDRILTLLNVIECVNALNQKATEWDTDDDGTKLSPLKYVFHQNRFSESSIFKIPETCKGEVLVIEREGDPETEFKAAVEAAKLTGLIFEELWDSEK